MGEPSGVRQVVVMGVSGVGKTTVAKGISTILGWTFAEGDAFHSEANVAKMASGQPLTDDDRWPWLRSIGDWMSEEIAAGRSSVVTCSALRRVYRDLLREGRPEVVFCHLVAGEDLIGERMVRRTDHYMPASLLPSQLATLEPLEPDEPGAVVSVDVEAAEVIARALAGLGLAPSDKSRGPSEGNTT
jgi:gluconokinase